MSSTNTRPQMRPRPEALTKWNALILARTAVIGDPDRQARVEPRAAPADDRLDQRGADTLSRRDVPSTNTPTIVGCDPSCVSGLEPSPVAGRNRPSCSATIVTALPPAAPAARWLVPDSLGVSVLAGERRPVSHRRVGEGGEPERSQCKSLSARIRRINCAPSRLVARDRARDGSPPALAVCRRSGQRRELRPVGMRARGEARTRERADRQAPVADLQAHRASAALVEVGMRGEIRPARVAAGRPCR